MSWTEEQYRQALANCVGKGTVSAPAPVPPPPAKGQIPEHEMNKTEKAYSKYLDLLIKSGEVLRWRFEGMKIEIGHRCWFTPDFLVQFPDGTLELHDTKGRKGATYYAEDDAIVKARAVGKDFPIPMFFVWPASNGSWSRQKM